MIVTKGANEVKDILAPKQIKIFYNNINGFQSKCELEKYHMSVKSRTCGVMWNEKRHFSEEELMISQFMKR